VVRAEAAGYAVAAPQAVLVDPETPTLHKVQFGATTKTGLEVRGKTGGLTLYLDGKLLGDLPKRITGLSVGEHTILVTGGEGFYAEERKLNLKADEMFVISDLELKPRMGGLHIAQSEQLHNATVLLDGVPIRLPYDKELDASRRYHVQVRKAGFDDFETWVEFSNEDREKRLDIQLSARQAAAERSAGPEHIESGDRLAAAAAPSESRRSSRSRASSGGGEATDQSRLNLLSDPPSMVLLDGKPIGQTPRMGMMVSPGTHSVLFIHPTLGRARASAKLDAGQSKTLRARF
jgi:serine/threonine-protein kinase